MTQGQEARKLQSRFWKWTFFSRHDAFLPTMPHDINLWCSHIVCGWWSSDSWLCMVLSGNFWSSWARRKRQWTKQPSMKSLDKWD